MGKKENKTVQHTQRTGKKIEGNATKKLMKERETKDDYKDNREHGKIKHKIMPVDSTKKDYSGNKAEEFTKKIKKERKVSRGKKGPSRSR